MNSLLSKVLQAAGIKLPVAAEDKIHSGLWKGMLMQANGYQPLLMVAENDRKLDRMASDAVEGATDFRTGAGPRIDSVEYFSVHSDGPPAYVSRMTTQNGVVLWKAGQDADSSREAGLEDQTHRVSHMGYLQKPKEADNTFEP